jgi:hypothetical protein
MIENVVIKDKRGPGGFREGTEGLPGIGPVVFGYDAWRTAGSLYTGLDDVEWRVDDSPCSEKICQVWS